MNRLILIGNGFDLAHGLKTSFKGFIEDYVINIVKEFFLKGWYDDKIIKIILKEKLHISFEPIDYEGTAEEAATFLKKIISEPDYSVKFKSSASLFYTLFKKLDEVGRVDVEVEFFRLLIVTTKHDLANLKKYNDEFEFLKQKLIEYLKKQTMATTFPFSDLLASYFTEPFDWNEFSIEPLDPNREPQHIYFLNFNYTHTIMDYVNSCQSRINTTYNYIHGSLDEKHGTAIFGFGDEFDKRYLEFEDQGNNELFKHIKSFEYSKTDNYFNLIRFIESQEYQVQIFGHSCGVSDRTMLREIFEHENCKSIKIFYYNKEDGTNDFIDKLYDIYRHFTDKGRLRKMIVPEVFCRTMPQPKNVK